MHELAGLTREARKRALDRFHLLQPHLENDRPLKAVAAAPGVCLPQQPLDAETVAAIIRITGGNFRLLNRLLTQMERILKINALQQVTKNTNISPVSRVSRLPVVQYIALVVQ